MNVLLINPPSLYLDNDAAYPPMGLMYVAAVIEREGGKAKILDLAGKPDWKGDTQVQISFDDFDLVGITCVTPNVDMVAEVIKEVPSNIPVMVGGPHATHLPDDTFARTGCDIVVSGEAELAIPSVLHGLASKVYSFVEPPVSLIPKPARHLVDLHRYKPGGEDATPVYTSRGCPFNCGFCSKLRLQSFRELPISRVVEEVVECWDTYGFRKIVFGDDNIAVRPKRLMELLDALRPLDISFRLNMDARHNDFEMYQKAAASGCADISFGIESGSQDILNAMHKRTSVEKNAEAIRMTQRAGMEAKAYFMVNFPSETEKTVKETLKFAEETRPDKWLLSSFAPLPGSDTFNHPEKYGITSMSKNWSDYYLVGKDGGFKPCFTTDYLTYYRQEELHRMMYEGLKDVLG